MDMDIKEAITKLSKKDRIKYINQVLGAKHRETPYNLNNPDDMIEAVEMVTGELMDMLSYSNIVINLVEDFDESLETYYPSIWLSQGVGAVEDEDLHVVDMFLSGAEQALLNLHMKAEKNCLILWKAILCGDTVDVTEHFFGKKIKISSDDFSKFVHYYKINCIYFLEEYDGSIPKSVSIFASKVYTFLQQEGIIEE